VTRCVHEDIRCCCKGQPQICGCANWPEEVPPCNPAQLLPDLDITIWSDTCPTVHYAGTLTRCGFGPTLHLSWWKSDEFPKLGVCNLEGYAILYCERNISYPNSSCKDYRLDFGVDVSGCQSAPQSPQYPSSCTCGDYSTLTPAVWEWIDIYDLVGQLGQDCRSVGYCDCIGTQDPIPISIRITGMPPAPSTFSSLVASKSAMKPRAKPISVTDDLPENVSSWLNGD
jgi:hypothetical protein